MSIDATAPPGQTTTAQAIVWAIGALRLAANHNLSIEAHQLTRAKIAQIRDTYPDLDATEQHYPAAAHEEFWVTKLISNGWNIALLFTNEPPPAPLITFADHLAENAASFTEVQA